MGIISIVEASIISSMATLVVTILYEAFKKPVPVTRLDHFIRVHFKKGKIKGNDLTYRTTFIIEEASEREVLDYLIGGGQKGKYYDLMNVGLSGVKIENLIADEYKIRGEINIRKLNGRLGFKIYKEDSDYDSGNNEENEVNLTFSVTIHDWGYKQVKDILFDISKYQEHVSNYLSKRYQYQTNETVVEFETNSEPVVLSYINKNDSFNDQIKIKLNGNVYAYFYKQHCEITGVKTSSDFEEIINAISWYV
ncbi:MAG: hypothetical protein QXU18_13400 [Thermoplasmatales archaeon]